MRADLSRMQNAREVGVLENIQSDLQLHGNLKVVWGLLARDEIGNKLAPDSSNHLLENSISAVGKQSSEFDTQESFASILDACINARVFNVDAAPSDELLTTTSEVVVAEARRDIEFAMERAMAQGPPLPSSLLRQASFSGMYPRVTNYVFMVNICSRADLYIPAVARIRGNNGIQSTWPSVARTSD